MRQKLRMSKTELVKYRVCEGDESPCIYWYLDNEKNKIRCQLSEMRPGIEYFCGKVKKEEN